MGNQFPPATARVAICVSLLVRQCGAKPMQVSRHDALASAYVAVLHRADAQKAMVLLADAGHGVSVTNAADELLTFIRERHLEQLGVGADETCWIYRDSEGAWDEILGPAGTPHPYQVARFHPLGSRTQSAALKRVEAEGFSLSAKDRELITQHLRLEGRRTDSRRVTNGR